MSAKFDVNGAQNVEVSVRVPCEKPVEEQLEIMEAYTETHRHFSPKELREAACLKVLYPRLFRKIEDGDLIAGRLDFLPIGFGCVTSVGGVGHYCVFNKLLAFKEQVPLPEQKERVDRLYEYWLDHDLKTQYCREVLTEDTIGRFIDVHYPMIATARLSGMMLDYPKLLDNGIGGLKDKVQKKLAAEPENDFYQAALECFDIFTGCAEALRDKALRQSEQTEGARKQELLRIARDLEQIKEHLYSQKPVGLTVEQVTEQMETAQANGVKFAASAIHPLRPDIIEIRRMIERGTLGKITLIRTHTAHGGPEYFQFREADCSWFFQPGAGALYDMGVHGITMAVAVLGPAKEVGCMAAVSEPERTIRSGAFDGKKVKADYLPDNYIITLNWGDGVIGVVDAGFTQRASTVNQFEIYGTQGTATIEGPIKIGEGDGLKVYIDDENLQIRGWMHPMPQELPHPGEFLQAEAVLDLIHAIETDTVPVLDPAIARHVVDIMCTIPQAIEEKRTLPLHTTF